MSATDLAHDHDADDVYVAAAGDDDDDDDDLYIPIISLFLNLPLHLRFQQSAL